MPRDILEALPNPGRMAYGAAPGSYPRPNLSIFLGWEARPRPLAILRRCTGACPRCCPQDQPDSHPGGLRTASLPLALGPTPPTATRGSGLNHQPPALQPCNPQYGISSHSSVGQSGSSCLMPTCSVRAAPLHELLHCKHVPPRPGASRHGAMLGLCHLPGKPSLVHVLHSLV